MRPSSNLPHQRAHVGRSLARFDHGHLPAGMEFFLPCLAWEPQSASGYYFQRGGRRTTRVRRTQYRTKPRSFGIFPRAIRHLGPYLVEAQKQGLFKDYDAVGAMYRTQSGSTNPQIAGTAAEKPKIDFSGLKIELYGDQAHGAGVVGENDAKHAREVIRGIAAGSNFESAISSVIGPDDYDNEDAAICHLGPYLIEAQKQGLFKGYDAVSAMNKSKEQREAQRRDYGGRQN